MRIRTQFILTLLLFSVLLFVIATLMIIVNQKVERLTIQEKLAISIERGAGDLGYLSNEYLLYGESQQRARWESKFASVEQDISNLDPEGIEQQAVVNRIKTNQQHLKAVFTDIVLKLDGTSQWKGAEADPASVRVPWSRMAVQNQETFFEAFRLSDMLGSQADTLRHTERVLILTLIGLFVAFLLSNYAVFYRRTLKSIRVLQNGAGIVGSGNLDYCIQETRNDEIGELTHAFNTMTANLKDVTASKTELQEEIAERKRLEEEGNKRAEELAVANKELEAFSYSISHDLRAPLRTVKGFSDILLEDYADKLDAEAQNYLKRIAGGTDKMSELIDDMLSLAKVSRQEMSWQKIDLSAIAHTVVNELRQAAPDRKMEISIAEKLMAEGDQRLLTIALSNLIGNAWKYTGKIADPRIEFGLTTEHGRTLYYVRDNGAGFDMKLAIKLFAPFQRLHTEAQFPGTGIGLAIVNRVIQRHRGRIWAEGEVGKGATFYFTLA